MTRSKSDLRRAVLLVAPSIIVVAVFVYGFIGWSLRVSMSAWRGIRPDWTFVGLENYVDLFNSRRFIIDIQNTFYFTIFFILLTVVVGFLLALLINRRIRGESFFRTLYLFPMALSFVVTGVIWRWVLNPRYGINVILYNISESLGTFGWYTVTTQTMGFRFALIGLILAASWQFTGYTMAMYLAGLRGIPDELIESARIDGATELMVVRKVILPLLRPITLSAMIVLGHISLKIFDLVYAMSGSGPAFATDFPGIFMFETTFRGNRYAQGAAISIIMLAMVALVVVPYLVNAFRREHT
ncbi:MAG: carbohydrate ABC transporter permease [Spirochaetaceae bacterium]